MSIRIVLAEDHRIVREGLKSLLEKQPDIEVIAEASDGQEAVRLVQELLPNIVVMDVAMPVLNGIEATLEIIEKAPGVKVIALSMYADTRFVLRMLKAGASGYVLKDCASEELNKAIRITASNQTYLSPQIAGMLVKDYLRLTPESDSSSFSKLTSRERVVLQLMAEGKSTKEIASNLNLSVKTIETHRKNIMDKVNIHNIAELTKYSIREGLTTLES